MTPPLIVKLALSIWTALALGVGVFIGRTRRPARTRRTQAGMAILIELLIVCVVMLVIAAAAIPNLQQVALDSQQSDAKDRVRIVGKAEAAAAICAGTQGCSVSPGLTALIPAPNSTLTTGGYTYAMAADGVTLTASPVNHTSGQTTFSVSASDVLLCGGAPCSH